MSDAGKKWFVHADGKQQGPLSMDELRARAAQRAFTAETPVWCQGMANWAPAKQVAELGSLLAPAPSPQKSPISPKPKPQNTVNTGELSALIEMNPRDFDDRTAAIDPKSLKAARKEAAKMEREEAKQVRKVAPRGVGSTKLILMSLPIAAAGILAGGLATGLFETDILGPQLKPVLEAMFSPLPKLEDVAEEDRLALLNAVKAKLSSQGPKAAIAVSNQSPDKPMFYVAGNLPRGTQLVFLLRGPTEIRFPLAFSESLVKTRALHQQSGGALPAGTYTVWVYDDEEQLPKIKDALAKFPTMTSGLPAGAAPGRKVLATRKVVIGRR